MGPNMALKISDLETTLSQIHVNGHILKLTEMPPKPTISGRLRKNVFGWDLRNWAHQLNGNTNFHLALAEVLK